MTRMKLSDVLCAAMVAAAASYFGIRILEAFVR